MDRKIKVAVIAAGSRAKGVVANLLQDSKRQVEIVSVYDPDPAMIEEALAQWWNSPNALRADSPEAAINVPGVEWVMIFSPNAFHKEHILMAFRAGKHVFSEKPLATTIEDCREIYAAHQKSNLIFATGFVLRYAPIYRKIKEILDSGALGELLSIEGNENIAPEHGSYIMCNWRRLTALAGPHILEKCCHDLDLINWFTNSLPTKVAAMSGRTFFVEKNASLLKKYPRSTFFSWNDPHAIASPFAGDTDLDDVLMSIAEFRNGIKVGFTATMSNALAERRMRFNCAEGSMIAELYTMTLRWKAMGADAEQLINFNGDGHAGGDSFIMKELFDTMIHHTPPKCSGSEGLASAVYALALDRAAAEGKIMDLEPIWTELGR